MAPSSSLALGTRSAIASHMGKLAALVGVSSDLSEGAEARFNDHTTDRVRGGSMGRKPSLPSVIRCRAERARCGLMWQVGLETQTQSQFPGCCCHDGQHPLRGKGLAVANLADAFSESAASHTACSSLGRSSSASRYKILRTRRGQLSASRNSKVRSAWLPHHPPHASPAHRTLPTSVVHFPTENTVGGCCSTRSSRCAMTTGARVCVPKLSGGHLSMEWTKQLVRKKFVVQVSQTTNCPCGRGICDSRHSFPSDKHGKMAVRTNALPSSVESNASVDSVVELSDDNDILCDICSGSGWLACDFCQGQKINVQVKSNRMYRRCPSCKAAGVLMCPKCKSLKCVTFPGLEDEPSNFSEWI